MLHEATLVYTESLLRQAVFAFWRRSIGVGFVVALAAVALSLGVFVAGAGSPWFVGALFTVLGVAFAVTLYFVHYRYALGKLREMGGAQATFRGS